MNHKTVSGIILTLLLIGMSILAFNVQLVKSASQPITVPDDYPTIQGAINAANNGDTIIVKSGTYYENVIVNKTLSLFGENMETTIIDGNEASDCVHVIADGVEIGNFTIRNGGARPGTAYSCVRLSSSGNSIIHNNLTDNWCGISMEHDSDYNLFANNTIMGNLQGISGEIWHNTKIIGNTIKDNLLGIWIGPYSTDNTISFNTITDHWDEGISMWQSSDNTFGGNNITDNNRGGFSAGITIGFQMSFSYGNKFFHNNIANNGKQVDLVGLSNEEPITWDDGYPYGGNYWSNYTGMDQCSGKFQNETGGDGIGDAPLIIGISQDNYPLMRPWVPFEKQTIYIRANGVIDPSGAPVLRKGNLYTLTSNITSGPNDGIIIERNNMTLDGANHTIQDGFAGIRLDGKNNITIKNIRIENVYYGNSLHSSSNITISGNYFSGKNTLTGIYFISSSNGKIYGNTFVHFDRGIDVFDSFDNSIHGNYFSTNTYAGILIGDSSNNEVFENYMTNSPWGMQIGMSSVNNIVTHNLITNNTSGGLIFTDSENNTITKNNITANGVGVYIDRSHRNNITRNDITGNNYGVYFDAYSEHDNIVENNITNNKKNGVTLYRSSYNYILCNNITANGEDGIHLDVAYSTPSTNNTIAGNYIRNNNRGIYCSASSNYNTISENTITESVYGFCFNSSSNNLVYHNNIISNTIPVFTFNSVNMWNCSFCEGNYWSNYYGLDLNRDGIGDTPHLIALYTDNQDYHPLMKPYIPNDCNHDGKVNIGDAARIGASWNTTKGTPHYNPHADLNMDMVINMADADIIRQNWQKHV